MRRSRLIILAVMLTAFLLTAPRILAEGGDKPYAAPDVSVKTSNKEKLSLSDFEGKVLLVQVAHVGAKNSDDALKPLKEIMAAKKGKEVAAVRVNAYQKSKVTAKFFKDNEVGFPVVNDYKGKLVKELKPDYFPCLYVIDKFGKVRYVGATDAKKVGALIDSLLAEKKSGKSFHRDPIPKFEVGQPVAPMAIISSVNKKAYNLYQVTSKKKFTFIMVTSTC